MTTSWSTGGTTWWNARPQAIRSSVKLGQAEISSAL
jgi:hypothetical protein